MGKFKAYLGCILFAGAILAGISIGEDARMAYSEVVQQTSLADVSAINIAGQAKNRAETMEAIEQYVNVAKRTGKHEHKLLSAILSNALKDDDIEVRAATVSALGALGDETVIPNLLSALRDKEMWVRLAAATAISDLNDKSIIPELVKMLADNDGRTRESAALTLGAMDYRGEVPGLREAIERKEISPRIVDYLLNEMNNPTEKDMQDYERKLKDKSDMYARIVGVLAFGKIGKTNKQAVVRLREALKDDEPVVRALSAVVLGKLEDKESLKAIERLAHDNDPVVRGVVALFMGRFGNKNTLPVLEKLTRDKEASVRASAALSLGKLGDTKGIWFLEELLFNSEEDNPAVKLMSVAALWKLTK
ncbi:MAG: HEAT repeat domain-containing protein [Candidatus Brocadia sp.]|jgi:HEAT repeat protein